MKKKVYAQLYSLLKTNQEELIPTLKQLSEIGYDGVELMGTYTAGMSIQEYKDFLKELKLDPISSHGLLNEEDYAKAQEIGVRFTDIRAELHDYSREAVLRVCEEMNKEAKIRAKYGLKSVLHNHSQEFRWVEGEEGKTRVYDLIISNTDPEYVSFELDTGWAAFSGVDPVEYVEKYPGRFPLIHVKEALRLSHNDDELEHFPADVLALGQPIKPKNPKAAKSGVAKNMTFFTEEQGLIMYGRRDWNGRLGKGLIDWAKLIDVCEKQGTVAYINEREYYGYEGGKDDSYVCAKQDYDYLRSLL